MIFASDGVGVVIRIKSAEIKIQWKNNSTNGPRSAWKRCDSSISDYVELLTLPKFNIHYVINYDKHSYDSNPVAYEHLDLTAFLREKVGLLQVLDYIRYLLFDG